MAASTPRQVALPTSDNLARARDTIFRALSASPLVALSARGPSPRLKLESLQPTGSFKVRGALAALARLKPGQRVLAASAGNHALGIAWAASQTGIPATVVIPTTASIAKRARLETFPVDLVRHGDSFEAAEAYALELVEKSQDGTRFVSPYNDPHVIAGQSTVLDEVIAQLPAGTPCTMVVPVGGGGLLAGIALRAEELRAQGHTITIVGVEAAASPGLSTAITAGQAIPIEVGETIADGLAGNLEPGSVTVGLIAERVDRIVQVTDENLRSAMCTLAWNGGVLAEASGAAALAAIETGQVRVPAGEAIVAIVSGRNIAHDLLLGILAR